MDRRLIPLFLCLTMIVGCESNRKESVTKRTATYYVSPNGSPNNSGLNLDSPLNSIKDALSKKDVRRVIIKKGVYRNCSNQIHLNAPSTHLPTNRTCSNHKPPNTTIIPKAAFIK